MEIEGLKYIGMHSDSRVNGGMPVPLYEPKERTDGRPSINTLEGWNAFYEERERKYPEIGERLTAAREQRGYSIPEVAEACGISIYAVDAYERGERMPRDSVKIAFAELYRKTVQSLFF